jgi:CHAD domain-containing protein
MTSCDAPWYDREKDHLMRKIKSCQYALENLNPSAMARERLEKSITECQQALGKLRI